MPSEGRFIKLHTIILQLEQVVLRLPHKGHLLEFAQGLLSIAATVLRRQHVIEYQLFAPLNNALDHIQRQHAQ